MIPKPAWLRPLLADPILLVMGGIGAAGAFLQAVLYTVLPLYLIDLGFSFVEVGALLTLVAGVGVGLTIASARLGPILHSRLVLLALLTVPSIALAAYAFVRHPLHLLALGVLSTTSSALVGPVVSALLAERVPHDARGRAFAGLGVMTSVAYGLGLLGAGVLVAVGYRVSFFAASVISFAMTATLAPLLSTSARRARRGSPARTMQNALVRARFRLVGAGSNLRQARAVPRGRARNARWAVLHTFAFTASMATFPVYFPRHLLETGLPPAHLGIVLGGSWFLFALFQPLGGALSDRVAHRGRLLAIGLAGMAGLVLLLPLQLLWIVVGAWLALGVLDGLCRPAVMASLAAAAPRDDALPFFARVEGAHRAARIVAPITLGLVIVHLSFPAALVISAVTLALSALPLGLLRDATDATRASASPAGVAA